MKKSGYDDLSSPRIRGPQAEANAPIDREPQKLSSSPPVLCAREPQDRRIVELIDIVKLSPSSNVALLARKLNLSKSRLEHLFKAQTGTPLKTYLFTCRIVSAAKLCLRTRLSVKEVAQRSGYSHTASLTRAFIAHYGVCPRTYRERNGRQLSSL